MRYSVFLLALLGLGMTSQRVTRVAIIDTGLDLEDPRFKDVLCESGHQDFTGEGLKDTHGHGTHIAGLIKNTAGPGNYCFIILKYYTDKPYFRGNRAVLAVEAAANLNVDLVNFSGGGSSFDDREYDAIRSHPLIRFIVAAGNNNQDIDNPSAHYYPASYPLPNVLSVGNLARVGDKAPLSNYGGSVKAWEIGEGLISSVPCSMPGRYDCQENMSGTSQATAVHTGRILKGEIQ